MMHSKRLSLMGYFVTILLAMCLKVLPLPLQVSHLNPDWVLLALIYWILAIPEKIGVFNALIIGLAVDILTGRLLGQNALAYTLISFTCLKLHRRLRQYPIPQQSLCIFLCLMFTQMMTFWIENIQSPTEFNLLFFMPVVIGTLCWPLVYSGLRLIRIFGTIT